MDVLNPIWNHGQRVGWMCYLLWDGMLVMAAACSTATFMVHERPLMCVLCYTCMHAYRTPRKGHVHGSGEHDVKKRQILASQHANGYLGLGLEAT